PRASRRVLLRTREHILRYRQVPCDEATMRSSTTAERPPVQTAEEKPARARILSAAFAAFTEHGFAKASTLEIATRAMVSKRELYALFGNKQQMLITCISERG